MTAHPVRGILSWYGGNPATHSDLVRMLNHGILAGTGKLVIQPVDQLLRARTGAPLRADLDIMAIHAAQEGGPEFAGPPTAT